MNNWLSIVLYKPQIPQNTGNIGRTCVGLGIPLYIVGRPGFHIEDRYLKRAGLDYWDNLKFKTFRNFEDFFYYFPDKNFYFFTKKGKKSLFEVHFKSGDCLIFGQETDGLPDNILEKYHDQTIYLPMVGKIRSYNLSNAVAIAAFEVFRQIHTEACDL